MQADYVDSLDLFHTMEAYFTWYPKGESAVSKYLLNKFLYTVDRDPDLVERYRTDPRGTVAWWEAERANVVLNIPEMERSTWLTFTDAEREALATHDYVTLFELGCHNFLLADAVHRVVRAGLRRAAGVPARIRRASQSLDGPVSGYLDLVSSRGPVRTS